MEGREGESGPLLLSPLFPSFARNSTHSFSGSRPAPFLSSPSLRQMIRASSFEVIFPSPFFFLSFDCRYALFLRSHRFAFSLPFFSRRDNLNDMERPLAWRCRYCPSFSFLFFSSLAGREPEQERGMPSPPLSSSARRYPGVM